MSDSSTTPPQTPNPALSEAGVLPTKVTWDDAKMTTSFANVVNVLATREEVTLLFGTNQTWNAMNSAELVVTLSDRIVLTPYAAKRLAVLLDRRVKEYEQRFGVLEI